MVASADTGTLEKLSLDKIAMCQFQNSKVEAGKKWTIVLAGRLGRGLRADAGFCWGSQLTTFAEPATKNDSCPASIVRAVSGGCDKVDG